MGRKVCGDRHCSCAAGGGDMLTELALGSLFFPALFSLCRRCLKQLPVPGWGETDAVILSSRLVSSVQAVMASSAGLIIVRSCRNNILETRHWLTNTYVLFAVPYFAYDIYAMYLCHWHRTRVKGHGVEQEACVSVLRSYLRKDLLMVIHHSVMFTICFPVSVFLRDGRGDYFVGCLFLAEVSTPFVCLGKVLIQTAAHPPAQAERHPNAADVLRLPSSPLPLPVLGVRAAHGAASPPCAPRTSLPR
ncbi:TLC domain containing 3Ba isoform X4 [Mobula hypostoma]|uniref:TLC domain containing 3Ba isoform X4 n=1 Tax=Mobula hypostoma TaxID=723540 RepID=UPI002FC37CCE